MYRREKIIDGVLCVKSSPRGKWRPMTAEQLTNRITRLENKIKNQEQ